MNRYIVFLRGVTPTGKNRVPMAQLREALHDNGFPDARTWIQSGNVILTSELAQDNLTKKVHDLILAYIGADLKIIVKTPEEVQAMLAHNPYHESHDIARVFFTLFNEKPDEQLIAALQTQDFDEDKFVFTSQAIYLYIPDSAARTKLTNNFLKRKLKMDATTRNFNTLTKMVELAGKSSKK